MKNLKTLDLIRDSFSKALDIYQKNWKLVVPVAIVYFVITDLPSLIKSQFGQNNPFYFLVGLIVVFLSIFMNIGLIHIGKKLYDGKKADVMELFEYKQRFWSYLWLTIKAGVYILLGFIALIVPGIILAIKYSFSAYLFVLKGMSVNESMDTSAKMVEGHKMKLFLYYIVMIFISALLGNIPIFGQLIAMPIILLMYMYVFLLFDKNYKK